MRSGYRYRDLRVYFPRAQEANLVKAHVVEGAARHVLGGPRDRSPSPHGSIRRLPIVFLAGDWNPHRWPATMEGAVRKRLLPAAEAVARSAGSPARFLLPGPRLKGVD